MVEGVVFEHSRRCRTDELPDSRRDCHWRYHSKLRTPSSSRSTHTHTQQSQTAYFTKRNRSRVAEEAGANGMMKNVCRVFNDKVGVVSIII